MTNNAKDIVAIIPARGGSKRLPGKNTLVVGGQPLIAHTLRHAVLSTRINTIYVSTDDSEIAAIAESMGAEVILRPLELAGDEASSESALLHALDDRNRRGLADPDLVVFLQCTSPVRGDGDIDAAISTFERSNADSLFSGSDNKRHIWTNSDKGYVPLNYDYKNRKREQDMLPQYNEDGSIYVIKPEILRKLNNRLGGKIAVYPMGPWREFQLDTQDDLDLIDWVLRKPEFSTSASWPETIELIVFDFDGVFTDNKVLTDADGCEYVRADRGDGLGIARLREHDIPMLVLSTEENPVTAARCKKLDLECQHGIVDKAARLNEILSERKISAENTFYVGNDINDSGCLSMVGFPIVVQDAHPSIKAMAHLILNHRGGEGAVRELCDLIISRISQSS